MDATLRHWSIRTVAGVLGTLAAAVWFAPSAHADCGDYVMIGNPQHTVPAHHAEPMRPEQPANAPTPCTGLRCSGGVPVLPMQPVSPPSEGGDDNGLPAALASLADLLDTGYVPDHSPLRAIGPRTTVYHPPR